MAEIKLYKDAMPLIPDTTGMSVAAFDLGRRTGWAVSGRGADEVRSGIFELYDAGGSQKEYEDGERFAALRGHIHDIHEVVGGLDLVAFEDVNPAIQRSKRSATVYSGYRAALMEWCATHEVLCVPIPVHIWKLAFTRKANATKADVIRACIARGHYVFDTCEEIERARNFPNSPDPTEWTYPSEPGEIVDDNEADALGILYALPVIRAAQRHAIDRPKRKRTPRKKPARAKAINKKKDMENA